MEATQQNLKSVEASLQRQRFRALFDDTKEILKVLSNQRNSLTHRCGHAKESTVDWNKVADSFKQRPVYESPVENAINQLEDPRVQTKVREDSSL
ncbi:MAG: hypothetical protein M1830_009968 [Pleopsidium flavum]|nr:MAG: hypothetical protein M1830_009968 [Pleopsidium flavum]